MVGVHYDTAYHWCRNGLCLCLLSSCRLGRSSSMQSLPCRVIVWCTPRVSSRDQAENLDLQVARVTRWATENGHRVDRVVTEVAPR